MIEWDVAPHALRVTDADNAAVLVRGTELTVTASDQDVPRPVDETVLATTRTLEFPHAIVYAFAMGADDRFELDPGSDTLSLPADEYVVDVDTEIKIYLRFSSAATIERTDDYESIVVTFPERTRVVVGFRSRHELPADTITVPDSPAALATALSHLSSSHKTTGPDRTYPTLRGHPPLLEPGDDLEIPEHLREATPETGVELLVPADYQSLYTVAPLAYYLQASVDVLEPGATMAATSSGTPPGPARGATAAAPRLRIPEFAVEEPLSTMPDLEFEVTQLLRKTFFLDCLVRNAGPYGTRLAELSLLEALELDAEELYDATPGERLAAYLEVPFAAIEHRLPDWHLSTYVTPEYDRVEALPYLLDRLSLIYTPRTSKLEGRELVERSLEDFYRGRIQKPADATCRASTTPTGDDRSNTGQVPSVDVVKPELRHGRVHGWLAAGVPIDVFKSATEAYANRLAYLERDSDAISICVVLNDPEMAGERQRVADIYRQRSEQLPMEVTVEESLRTADLARVFESEHDFVHYIGHCETDGLRCADGYLSTSSLDRCRVQTFFLNACGSFYEGRALVEKGSVAGAVTFTKVLNEHALKVGSTFAKLLVHGFSIERAMRLARRRIMMGKDYAVVGDGTHSLTQGEHRAPTTMIVDPIDSGDDGVTLNYDDASQTARDGYEGHGTHPQRFLVTFDCYSTRVTGSYYFPHTEENDYAYLCGRKSHFTLSRGELTSLLKETEASVVYDGDLYWSEDLWSEFAR
ncbi:hypothetical protein [Natrarchaeobaculum aegyptiacum]|uniref:CHAT domain-containing protein n=1 Tax=Natrarchaeobaculum aegyptiacum TaxID=745377 RepID=A0A2Z2HU01_9EURY|nr:hypothetical protein [Natrarchaeobaculum aegyptiacum]ARS88917.1 hypothetical protein B1756_03550 [Natrarchaeobaculum aegyptiacum]